METSPSTCSSLPTAALTGLATPVLPPSPPPSRPSRRCGSFFSGKQLREAPRTRPKETRRSCETVPVRRNRAASSAVARMAAGAGRTGQQEISFLACVRACVRARVCIGAGGGGEMGEGAQDSGCAAACALARSFLRFWGDGGARGRVFEMCEGFWRATGPSLNRARNGTGPLSGRSGRSNPIWAVRAIESRHTFSLRSRMLWSGGSGAEPDGLQRGRALGRLRALVQDCDENGGGPAGPPPRLGPFLYCRRPQRYLPVGRPAGR